MKLLLDEQIPREIGALFPDDFEVHTAQSQSFAGVRNGELLRGAAAAGFDALVTADKNMEHQQNAAELLLTVIVLYSVRIRVQDLAPLVPGAINVLRNSPSRAFIRIHPELSHEPKT